MQKLPIIIDCDPGIDDSLALLYAFATEKFDIKAIHTVSGNVSVVHTTNNARGILGLIGKRDVSIHAGSNKPMVNKAIFADDIHGKKGLGGADIPTEKYAPLAKSSAFASYVDILEASEDKITIVAIGPLTNIAILLNAHPELSEKIAQIVMMGGGIGRGNTTAAAEFNFYADPHAAKVVLETGLPLVLAGLNVTDFTRFYEKDMQTLAKDNEPLGRLLLDLNAHNIDFMEEIYDDGRYTTPHDVMPFMYLARPDIFETEDMAVIVDANDGPTKGMSYRDSHRKHMPENVKVITQADNDAYRRELMDNVKVLHIDY